MTSHAGNYILSPHILSPSPSAIAETLKALEAVRHRAIYGSQVVSNIGNGRAVKYGYRVSPYEAVAMEYVRSHTTIPVPAVHMVFQHKNVYYIVMDFIEGTNITVASRDQSEEWSKDVASQLKLIVDQLVLLGRVFPGPEGTFGSWPNGPYQNLFFSGLLPKQSFRTNLQFHQYWVDRLRKVDPTVGTPASLTASLEEGNSTPVLPHGDLSPSNIMVQEGKIVAVLDWEAFGWYPEFWEYMLMYRSARTTCWRGGLITSFGLPSQLSREYAYVVSCVTAES